MECSSSQITLARANLQTNKVSPTQRTKALHFCFTIQELVVFAALMQLKAISKLQNHH